MKIQRMFLHEDTSFIQKLYQDEKKKERERYHQRKAQEKIKSIGEMSARNQWVQRREWQKRSK